MLSTKKRIKNQLIDLQNIIRGSQTLDQSEKNFIDGYIISILVDVEYIK